MKIDQKIVLLSVTLLAAGIGLLMWWIFSFRTASPAEFQAVQETLQRAERVGKQAAYTLDASQLVSVYVNDARGWSVRTPLQWLYSRLMAAFDREAGRGYLASRQAYFANRRIEYQAYLAGLRQKEAAGLLTDQEALILQGETYGWPPVASPAPVSPSCQPALPAGYPLPSEAQPCRPTPLPTTMPLQNVVLQRGPDPDNLPPEAFTVEVHSVRLRGNEARVVVRRPGGISEIVLVKVSGQWFVAGMRLLEPSY